MVMLVIGILACETKPYRDLSSSVSSEKLPIPRDQFESVAWFDEDHLAFIYRPDELASNNLDKDFRLGIFQISTSTMEDITLTSLSSDCNSERNKLSNLSSLPDGSLGFMFHCQGKGYSLYVFEPDTGKIVKKQTYLGFIAKSFSFSPDMSKLVQENGDNGGLGEKLLLVSSDNTLRELLPGFQRARSPAWSPNGKVIAFAGTKDRKENEGTNSWQDTESLFYYPWDIYLIDTDGSNPRILLPLVGTIYGLKWSPTNPNLLLFGGNSFGNVPGVWLLNVTNMTVMRVWDKNSNFDWSPTGSQIVLLDDTVDIWWRSVKIIKVPEQ